MALSNEEKISQIHDLKEYLVTDYYGQVRHEQLLDDQFYKDTFPVPQVSKEKRIQRTGKAARMIDNPSEHIITSNPQAYRYGTKKDEKIARLVNSWIHILKRMNPNPFKENVKKNMLRGESWIQVMHNERWVTGTRQRTGLPVLFTIPDPMIIYADPNEDENGIPDQVIVYYETIPYNVKRKFIEWSNPKQAGIKGNPRTVKWLEWWNADEYYFECDGEPVLKGVLNRNLYGVTPFVHKLAGFGTSSPDGKPEDIIVGRLRKVRPTLTRQCAIVSDIDSTFHLYANKIIQTKITQPGIELPDDFSDRFELGPNMKVEVPFGVDVTWMEEKLPEAPVFQYYYKIEADLDKEDPVALAGLPAGESGRQQDMITSSAMARYGTIVENVEYAFSTAFGMALQIIQRVPGLMPDGYNKEDIGDNYDVTVKLKAEDPLDQDRKATLGSRLYQAARPEIDPITNLIEFKGYTQEKAEEIMVDMLAWKVILESPDIAELIGLRAVEKAGMAQDIEYVKQRRAYLEKQQKALVTQPPPTTMERSMGEVQPGIGREMIDEALRNRGARRPPERYVRGQ